MTVTPRPRDRDVDEGSLYNQTDFIKKSGKHTLVTGAEIGRDSQYQQVYTWAGFTAVALPNWSTTMPVGAARTMDPTHTQGYADAFGIYVNDTYELNKQWKLIGGVRWDRFAAQHRTITNANGSEVYLTRTDTNTSLRGGAVYQPDEAQSYYASYGTSFNPSAEAVTLSATNSLVEPEENQSFEVGGKWDLYGGNLSLTSALFRIEKTNARTTDPVTSVITLDGETRVDGFEIGASGKLGNNWQLFGGYTRLAGEILAGRELNTEGNALQNTPENTASLWATRSIVTAWEVGGGAVYTSDRFVNNTNTAVIDGYTRYDATIAYRQKSYDVRLNLLNLNEEEYFSTASGSRATPAQGRAAVLTLSLRR